ncbi:MAG: GAF domain-containing protein [Fluviicola sp.]|jgi:GAF domain-containing protein
MAEELIFSSDSKEVKYKELIPQIQALLSGENNQIANLSNASSALKMAFDFFWVGFYIVDSENELVLGPFQGPIACTRIRKGKGVCGTSWLDEKTILVPNVEEFPGHIACSSASKSEIVVPLIKNNKVVAVLDVDSDQLNDFDQIDEKYLTQLCTWLAENCF